MPKMNGLCSSSRDRGVVVIGAMNRSFDSDDVVLGRLPKRLLINFPGEKERREDQRSY